MVGIHARTGREKIFSQSIAHVLNDETQRKYIQVTVGWGEGRRGKVGGEEGGWRKVGGGKVGRGEGGRGEGRRGEGGR